MRRIILSGLLILATIAALNAQIALVNQIEDVTTSGSVAQDFETVLNGNDCRIADDFVVPSGDSWYIDSIILYGFYNVNNPDSAGMNLTIYQNNSGTVGAQVYTELIQVELDPENDGSIIARWSTPVQINSGSYWLAASARKNYLSDQGIWYWYLEDSDIGYEALWENPGGSWNVCTAWTQITNSSCVAVGSKGVAFQMFGCMGTTKPSINNLPDDTTFCQGQSTSVTATSSVSGVSFAWNTGDSSATINITQSGHYVVTAYDPVTLCGSKTSMNVFVTPGPVSNVENDTICQGQSKSFYSNSINTNYQWSTGSNLSSIQVSTEGWVSVTMTDFVTGCTNVDSGWLEIVPFPAIEFTPDNPAHGCKGDTLWVGTNFNYSSYAWLSLGWSALNDSSHVMSTKNTQYFLTVTSSAGCQTNDTLNTIFHNPPTPEISIDYTSSWKTRLSGSTGYQTYEWSNGQTDPVITVSKNGPYSLTVTDEFGCTGSVTLYVITIPAGVDETERNQLMLYPNPAQDFFVFETSIVKPGDKIDVIDILGRTMKSQLLSSNKTMVDVNGLTNGNYTLVWSSGSEKQTFAVVIDKGH